MSADRPIRIRDEGRDGLRRLSGRRSVEAQVLDLPQGLFVGANRYDTDDEHTLHLWTADGQSYDVKWPKR